MFGVRDTMSDPEQTTVKEDMRSEEEPKESRDKKGEKRAR